MKILMLSFLLVSQLASAQSCSAPQAMTNEQKTLVSGNWVGHYKLGGIQRDFSVHVDFQSGAEALTINNPPTEGAATGENLRFCHSGAFHFRKTVADGYFEFDGVPGSKEMKGVLIVDTKLGRKTGEFVLRRAE